MPDDQGYLAITDMCAFVPLWLYCPRSTRPCAGARRRPEHVDFFPRHWHHTSVFPFCTVVLPRAPSCRRYLCYLVWWSIFSCPRPERPTRPWRAPPLPSPPCRLWSVWLYLAPSRRLPHLPRSPPLPLLYPRAPSRTPSWRGRPRRQRLLASVGGQAPGARRPRRHGVAPRPAHVRCVGWSSPRGCCPSTSTPCVRQRRGEGAPWAGPACGRR